MKKHEWTFEFSAGDVAKAAGKKADFHAGRAKYWKSQLTVAEAQLHEQDAEGDAAFDPSAHDSNVFANTSYGSMRDKAESRVVSVRGKMREHGAKIREFRLWEELLYSNRGETTLTLHRDDVEYFDLLAVVEPPEGADA